MTAEEWKEIEEMIDAAVEDAKADMLSEIRHVEREINTLRQEMENSQ